MDNSARIVVWAILFALFLGMAVVLTDKEYRPARIAETNRQAFSQIPLDPAPDPADPAAPSP